jgi:hypothetical protein
LVLAIGPVLVCQFGVQFGLVQLAFCQFGVCQFGVQHFHVCQFGVQLAVVQRVVVW